MTIKQVPDWLVQRQAAAAKAAASLPMPTFERFDFHRWALDTVAAVPDDTPAVPTDLGDQNVVTFGDQTVHVQLSAAMQAQGVIVEDLQTALTAHSDLVEKYLMTTAVKYDEDRLTAFNLAHLNHGLLIYVPANVQVDETLQVLMVQNSLTTTNYFGHVLVIADRSSSVKILQQLETRGDQANHFHLITEVLALENSHIEFTGLDLLHQNTTAYLNRRGYLADDAKINWALGVFNNGQTIADFDSDLRGKGSDSEVNVVALSGGKQRQCIDTRVTNFAPHSTGNIAQRGVILGSSELVFNGIGQIIKGAHGARANQENRVLMLSDKAHGDANPILLIDENDVLAGHAASVGRVDEHQMYYLMSRGIPKPVAQRLVIRGFLGDVLVKLPSEQLRDRMIAVIEEKLQNELAN